MSVRKTKQKNNGVCRREGACEREKEDERDNKRGRDRRKEKKIKVKESPRFTSTENNNNLYCL